MYMPTIISALLTFGVVSSKPLPPNAPIEPESARVVDVTSSSYSSLIVFNPAAAPTSSPSSSDSFITPSGVVLPEASATLSLQGNLPSASVSTPASSGVRVVGQGSSGLEGENSTTEAVKENSAGGMSVEGWMFVGVGSALVAVLA